MNRLVKISLSILAMTAAFAPAAMAAEDFDAPASAKQEVFASAVSDEELSTYRGAFGNNNTMMFSNLSATLQGNSAENSVSGANNIGDGALNNVTGLTSIIQNSGNNVIIQSSFQVNVNFQ